MRHGGWSERGGFQMRSPGCPSPPDPLSRARARGSLIVTCPAHVTSGSGSLWGSPSPAHGRGGRGVRGYFRVYRVGDYSTVSSHAIIAPTPCGAAYVEAALRVRVRFTGSASSRA